MGNNGDEMNAQDTLFTRLLYAAKHYEGRPLHEIFVADLLAAAQIVKDSERIADLMDKAIHVCEIEGFDSLADDFRETIATLRGTP
jgi:DNA-binding GntR family transcriptional regulator